MTARKKGFQPINFVFGILMGSADIVPGVSGGTVALIVGIYERLIASVRSTAAAAVDLIRLRPGDARKSLGEVEWGLVLPLLIGILTALVVAARLLVPALEAYPVQFRALFFGLIAASLGVPWRRIRTRSGSHYIVAGLAAVAAFILVGLPPAEIADPALIAVFLAASIAICAMILPGISGAFLLLVMGMYEPTLRALNELQLAYVAVFALGAAVGLGVFSKLLNYLLESHHDVTMAALVGLMLGSLRALWPYQDADRSLLAPPSAESLMAAIGLAALGFVIVAALLRFGSRIEEKTNSLADAEA